MPSCSNNEPSSNEISTSIQQYKWVCRTSDEPLVDDDYQWAIFDDYVITLYFVSDYECVVRYHRKHFDTDDGTSYENDSQTVKYTTQGRNIILDYSNYTETEFVYNGEFISSTNSVYEKEAITYSDREWLEENFKHIELEPDASTSKAFMGLKEICDGNWNSIVFGNPQCDENGRLTYYKTHIDSNTRYEYSGNTIICKRGTEYQCASQKIYTLSNGLITSFVEQLYDEDEVVSYTRYYTIKYDSNKRIIQIINDNGEGDYYSKTYYNFKWNSSGDLYESNIVHYKETEEPSYITTYEYLTSTAQMPGMILTGYSSLYCAFSYDIDAILVMEGYFGNSIPKHNLKSMYEVMYFNQKPYERYNWTYNFDSKGRITKVTQVYEDLYHNGKDNTTKVFTFKWE